MIGSLAALWVWGVLLWRLLWVVCVCVLKFVKHAIALTTPKIYEYDRFVTTNLKKKQEKSIS